MEIPVLYDLLWIVIPLICIALTVVVFLWERRHGSSSVRTILWCLVQFGLPLLGFLLWLVFRRFPRGHSAGQQR
ncbi:PLDc N-terminal domain-containing protein [Corynebacterium confusum]|uniref:PLDc N-terminal domain-containing protein n=1 Tax=Corynebacterium confusum TaxID=71254 RepID=UPI0033903686